MDRDSSLKWNKSHGLLQLIGLTEQRGMSPRIPYRAAAHGIMEQASGVKKRHKVRHHGSVCIPGAAESVRRGSPVGGRSQAEQAARVLLAARITPPAQHPRTVGLGLLTAIRSLVGIRLQKRTGPFIHISSHVE
jgi:hypothetical protein